MQLIGGCAYHSEKNSKIEVVVVTISCQMHDVEALSLIQDWLQHTLSTMCVSICLTLVLYIPYRATVLR